MGWNDGATKELNDYLESLKQAGSLATEAITQQIDLEAEKVRAALTKTAPRGKTGGLVASLTKAQVAGRREWYGYSLTFKGSHPDGTPYQKIANILNFGTSHIKGTRFISKAIRQLRGMDDRINARFEEKTQSKGE